MISQFLSPTSALFPIKINLKKQSRKEWHRRTMEYKKTLELSRKSHSFQRHATTTTSSSLSKHDFSEQYPLIMQPGCILKFSGIHRNSTIQSIRTLFSLVSPPSFIDYKLSYTEGYLRYPNSHEARLVLTYFQWVKVISLPPSRGSCGAILASTMQDWNGDYIKLELLNPQEEEDYWNFAKQCQEETIARKKFSDINTSSMTSHRDYKMTGVKNKMKINEGRKQRIHIKFDDDDDEDKNEKEENQDEEEKEKGNDVDITKREKGNDDDGTQSKFNVDNDSYSRGLDRINKLNTAIQSKGRKNLTVKPKGTHIRFKDDDDEDDINNNENDDKNNSDDESMIEMRSNDNHMNGQDNLNETEIQIKFNGKEPFPEDADTITVKDNGNRTKTKRIRSRKTK